MSPAFIKGVTKHLPNAQITFDKFHVIAHASTAVDKTRRIEQKTDPSLKGLRWKLLRDRAGLTPDARADLDALGLGAVRLAEGETVIENAARPQMRVLRGTLAALGPLVSENKVKSPALIVIGEVAGRGDMMELKKIVEAVQ